MLRGPLIPFALTASIIADATLEASKPRGTWQFLKSHHAQTLTFRDSSSERAGECDGSHGSSVRAEQEDMKNMVLARAGLAAGITNKREAVAMGVSPNAEIAAAHAKTLALPCPKTRF
ncbi:hypothetical protein VNO80_21091 [Phaseolus coccineus]|uniref:Uncharacterized protein n=1 Tax=Phaseolus coccineus TaxID=3886 RepID=A0AAN9M5H9_PHACN